VADAVCCSPLLLIVRDVDVDRSERFREVELSATDGVGVAWLALDLDAVRSEYLVAVEPMATDGGGEQSVVRFKGDSLLSAIFSRASKVSTSFVRKTPSRLRFLLLLAGL